ncbi:BadF/BadG/BcrA/BcrD ATPase family protein [Leifsonia sp. F6_8S_P_1B]|uniref:BadF/BadG/BcrA/BcrD ATPase family protein n=1 Tax=Leifsonia williamsii TaxID=3035919 RepID=A0ABT8K8A3_9MICO|nr:BadF/BadG/BcrA/BcrD ATPase family protein [Leifsonia williamsii]MDN4613683.1 BadF/BadG/BcrA/BcrD ATPase family protein [Leifsonia williamsii]
MSTEAAPQHIAIDLGKTNCRVRVEATATSPARERRGAGFPGLAAEGGVDAALAAIVPLLDDLGPDPLGLDADGLDAAARAASADGANAGAASAPSRAASALAAGAAGADSDRDATRLLAQRLHDRLGLPVAIASDVLTAHLGAFAGAPGTVLIAGTGAVAYRIAPDGTAARADGYGPWLGDEGSGRWIGQSGLQAALRAADGRGPATALVEDARTLADGDLSSLPRRVAGGPDVARSLASFAPAVLRRAAEGDEVARAIVHDAAGHLAATAASVAASGSAVSITGGLADDPALLRTLLDELLRRDLVPHRPVGSPLDGAALLAARRDLPHERYVTRA